jgi:hypothetical protein
MSGETRTARNYVLTMALALAAYVCSFYLLPRRIGGGFPPPPSPTFLNTAYNGVFYPMRWATQRVNRSYKVSVGKVDPQSRQVLLMVSPKLGHYLRYRARDEAVVQALKPGDRIRVTVEFLPHFLHDTSYDEFRSCVRLP